MDQNLFPTIDPAATGRNIQRLRKARGLAVRDLQSYFGFEDPQAIYRWQWGRSLPSVDNLYALSALLHVSMNDILVPQTSSYTNEKTADLAVFPFMTLFRWIQILKTVFQIQSRTRCDHFCSNSCRTDTDCPQFLISCPRKAEASSAVTVFEKDGASKVTWLRFSTSPSST